MHCYDDVHILRDTASYLQRAVKQSYIPPTWSKIKPCSPQIRRSSGFQPSLRWMAEEEKKFSDLSFCRLGESWITEVPKTCNDPRQCIIESIPMSHPMTVELVCLLDLLSCPQGPQKKLIYVGFCIFITCLSVSL